MVVLFVGSRHGNVVLSDPMSSTQDDAYLAGEKFDTGEEGRLGLNRSVERQVLSIGQSGSD